MSLIGILLVICIVGVFVWLLTQLPMPPIFRNIVIAVAALVVLLWLLRGLGGMHLPRL
jgi:hypothetical protein